MADIAVCATGLHKSLRNRRWPWRRAEETRVLRGVDLQLDAGEIVALVGPNGAGKSTLLRILATLLVPDAGEVEILGIPISDDRRVREITGFATGGERSLFHRLTARDNLRFFASLYGIARRRADNRINELARVLQFDRYLDCHVGACPAGIRALLGTARAILHRPRLLLLDEPTANLDPVHAQQTLGVLIEAAETGTTVFFVTHDLGETARIADRVLALRDGMLESVDSESKRSGIDGTFAAQPVRGKFGHGAITS